VGLDVSHDAFSGSYGAFSQWREALAIAAGKPPLALMEGFFFRGEIPGDPLYMLALGVGCMHGWGDGEFVANKLYAGLPIRWECLAPDALHELLMHDDNEGEIESCNLEAIAERLEHLAPLMPEEILGRGLSFREATVKFAAGCRAAAALGEPLLFR
jgi:hypothetical protein